MKLLLRVKSEFLFLLQAQLDQTCGTPAYIAPELVGETSLNYTRKCDVYHLICLLMWMFC